MQGNLHYNEYLREVFAVQKESVSIRLDPPYHSLLKKIAKEEYGSESKKGFVVENAIQVYQAQRTRPLEASAILSVTEEKIIDRLDKRFNDIGKNMVERIGNLVAKSSYENTLQSLLLEDLYFNAGFHKGDYERRRKDSSYRMKGRLEKEGIDELPGIIEENEHLKKINNDIQNRLNEAAKVFKKIQTENERLESENKELLSVKESKNHHIEQLQAWSNGLAAHLKTNYSRIKSNDSLIQEYINNNPVPKG